MSNDLTGRRALVTGAGHGIGAGIALALAEAGADVIVHYGQSAGRGRRGRRPDHRSRPQGQRDGCRCDRAPSR